jgi:hypothetical protein
MQTFTDLEASSMDKKIMLFSAMPLSLLPEEMSFDVV